MGHYLFRGSYTVDGIKGVMQEGGTARAAAFRKVVSGVGGTVEAMYWAFGDDDVVVIAELPNSASAAAVATSVSASGVASVSTTVLITAEEMDAAGKIKVAYRAPGG